MKSIERAIRAAWDAAPQDTGAGILKEMVSAAESAMFGEKAEWMTDGSPGTAIIDDGVAEIFTENGRVMAWVSRAGDVNEELHHPLTPRGARQLARRLIELADELEACP